MNVTNSRGTAGTTRDGIIVGLIGFASVALFYSIFDLLAARGALYTVNMLGRAVFRGLRDVGVKQFPTELDWGAVIAYNALHLVAALAIGLVVVALVRLGQDNPERRGFVRFTIVAGFVATVLVVAWLTAPMRPVLPQWSIVVANLLAVIFAGAYLIARDRRVLRSFALLAG